VCYSSFLQIFYELLAPRLQIAVLFYLNLFSATKIEKRKEFLKNDLAELSLFELLKNISPSKTIIFKKISQFTPTFNIFDGLFLICTNIILK
jgi:hypothetical protein